MAKIAIITGSINEKNLLKGFKQQIVKTMYGNVLLFKKNKVIFLPRHGKNKTIPPHRINHKANMCALNLQGVEKIISINSVGSLKEKIKPGTFILPDDYINFTPQTFFELEIKSTIPILNENLRKEIKKAAKKLRIVLKATYIQTQGPRYETKAEINVIKKWADIVGMTMPSEATLANELAIPYAALCVVDNYANGIAKKKLNLEAIEKTRKKNMPKIEKIIKEFIKINR